ncbi:putative kinase [Motilibacter rhizosphaerae]|uniref:Putative kinase n=1 Tax=Motilibacter rhizosphaerae TaxID=598652 RepID=A0A4Q7NFY3_9ACTN|nr:AAA family ATPase [Motilibacter rhizosphaerae]RZS82712.1 putative kinase [Motilibacter rhizosphaerae]
MLIVLSGLPASGKSTVARAVVARTRAVPLRLDLVEQAVVASGSEQHPVGPVGYYVLYALADDLLRQGFSVIADAVNAHPGIRDHWRSVAESAGVPVLEVEVRCSDPVAHQRRAEERTIDIAGLPRMTWSHIEQIDYQPWDREVLRIDTAVVGAEQAAELVAERMGVGA